MCAVPAQTFVNFQKAVNQMQDVLASIRTSSCCAKMGTATKGAVFIDEAPGGEGIKHRAGPIRALRLGFSPRSTKGLGRDKRLATRQVGRFSSEAKLAALRAQRAGALDRLCRKLGVDGFYLGNGIPLQSGFWIGGRHEN
jgi:hypothetical protein